MQHAFTFVVDDMARLRRFLVLGVESATFYAREQEVGLDNALALRRLLQAGRGEECVELIAQYAREGRCAKQNPIVFALAMCARFGDLLVRKQVYKVLGDVCAIPTTFFAFLEYVKLLHTPADAPGAPQRSAPQPRRGQRAGVGAAASAGNVQPGGTAATAAATATAAPAPAPKVASPAGAGKGWGRLHREGVAGWYVRQDAMRLAVNLTKYRVRKGWSHLDVLRLCHAVPPSEAHQLCFQHVSVPKLNALGPEDRLARAKGPADHARAKAVAEFLCATAKARVCTEEEVLVELIQQHRLVREHLPTTMLDKPAVWRALLPGMPLMALLRNVNKMTAVGVLTEDTEEGRASVQLVVDKLGSEEALKSARVHPFNVLLALRTYMQGHGFKGQLSWQPVARLVAALEQAFYASFRHVPPTGKRLVVALDVSGSMSSPMMGSPLSSREAAAAILMTFLRAEPPVGGEAAEAAAGPACRVVAFCDNLVELPFTRDSTLEEIVRYTERMPFGATDCALPMTWATDNAVPAEAFVVITDNETNCGRVPPAEALRNYRVRSGIPDAKLAVLATAANPFTIADPSDAGMLDMAGMDSAVPALISQFIAGKL